MTTSLLIACALACGHAQPATFAGQTGRQALPDWVVRADPGDVGLRRAYARGDFGGRRVVLPYSPNAASVTGTRGQRSFDGSVAWYRTRVPVGGGDYAIRFESVNHEARVWIDGREVGRHTGTYLPFEARVHLSPGPHTLVVRADWRHPQRMKHDGWHRTWFNFGGINREVTIRRLGASELDSPGVVTRRKRGAAAVTVSVRVRNRAAATRALTVTGSLGATRLRFPAVRLEPGRAAWVRTHVSVAHPKLWAPGHPALYPLHLAVAGESGYQARVGLREISWRGGRLAVNGRRLGLQGASLQEDVPGRGDAMRPADMDAVVERLKAIHATLTRSQHPLNPALLERLDAAGILVWQGIGMIDQPGRWSATTPARRHTALRRVRLNVLQARANPSVLAWNLINEVDANGEPGGQRGYLIRAAGSVHALDHGRPVALDVWGTHLPARAGRIYAAVDAVGVTDYEGWYADLFAPGATVEAHIRAWLARVHATFPGKPVVVTEFGAESNALNAPDVPGGFAFQSRRLAEHVRAYRSDPRLSGMLVWNLQDFAIRPSFDGGSIHSQSAAILLQRGINAKGLFTYGGRPKPAARTIARLFRPRASRAAAG